MSLRSTLSTICIRFVIAFFVQERIFVYGNECLCKCNTNDVCDELERLATNDDTKRGELEKWKIYIPFLKTLHQNFDLELLFERLTKIENKIDSTEDLKGKLKETESHVTRLEDALENVKKEFEKKMADFAQEMRDVQSKTMTLEGNVKEAEKVITATKINVSTINERMHVVENQMKLFLPVIEAEKRTGDQLKINISTIESRMNVLENQIKNFELVTEEEKRNREELEENMEIHREFMSNFERNDMKFQIITSEMEQRLSNVENEVENFTVSMKAEKKAREDLEEEMLRNTSKRFSNVYKQYRNLKNDFDTKLLNVIEDTKLLKSDVEKEKSARKNYSEEDMEIHREFMSNFERNDMKFQIITSEMEQRLSNVENEVENFTVSMKAEKKAREDLEENMKTYRNITSIIESKDKKFQTAISEAEQRLSNVKNEVENFKASIKAEKEARQELEEEMLRNTSKRFSNVNKQYRNLKNDFDRKLLNVIEDTKLLKSDVEKEKSARKNYSEENMKRYRNITSVIGMNELKLQFDMMNVDQRLFNLENKVEISETSIKAEKKARQELEENMKTQWNVMSIVESRNMKFETAISKAEQRLSNVENEVENFKASIKAEKEAREELEVKLRTNFSTTSRLNNEEHSEIRKNLTSIERELSNLQRIISLKDTSFNKLQGKVKDISAKMPQLISDIAEEKAAREDLVGKVKDISAKMPVLESELAEEKAAREDLVSKLKFFHPLKGLIL